MRMRVALMLILCSLLPALGCHNDMYDLPYVEEMEASEFFPHGQSVRPLPVGVVSLAAGDYDPFFNEGLVDGELAESLPMPVTPDLLAEGQEHFITFCSPCHGETGIGNGIVVLRGFSPPPSYHTPQLRQVPVGHIYRVITYGFGTMYSYANRIEPRHRWAVAAYVRALQLSQYAPLAIVPEDARERLAGVP